MIGCINMSIKYNFNNSTKEAPPNNIIIQWIGLYYFMCYGVIYFIDATVIYSLSTERWIESSYIWKKHFEFSQQYLIEIIKLYYLMP